VSKEQTHQNICESLGSSTNLDKLAKIRQNQGVSAKSIVCCNAIITSLSELWWCSCYIPMCCC